ncbi:hypothetical protein JXA85_03830 [Candidatus Woesearchaeota archaeon]|nr:hypothetical protein [Candidatus Woesearchaeota archaeon]
MERIFTSIVILLCLGLLVYATVGEERTITDQVTVGTSTPVVSLVNLDDTFPGYVAGAGGDIALVANTTTIVWCVGVVNDLNGYGTISNVTAVLWDNATDETYTSNNNTKYLNQTPCEKAQLNDTAATFNCTFNVYWIANATGWRCTANVTDSGALTSGLASVDRNIGSLLSLDVYENNAGETASTTLDFGTVNVNANSTNDKNVTVESYSNVVIDYQVNGTALNCSGTGSINVQNVSYSLIPGQTIGDQTQLTGTKASINANISKPTLVSTVPTSMSHWRIQVPEGVAGTCSGAIMFTAIANA